MKVKLATLVFVKYPHVASRASYVKLRRWLEALSTPETDPNRSELSNSVS